MRTILVGALCAALVFVLSGCASTGGAEFSDIEVEVAANPDFDLGSRRTYAWAAAAAAVRDPDREWTPTGLDVGSEITFLVDRELRERDRSAVIEAPDMLAIYAVGVDMKALDVKVDEEDRTVRSETTPRAGLTIVLVDRESRRAMWIARAVGNLSAKPSVELVKRRLENAVRRMFAEFPR